MKKLLRYFWKPVYNRTKDIEEIIVKTLKMLFAICKIVGFLRIEVNLL
jgi:hypothetical protein